MSRPGMPGRISSTTSACSSTSKTSTRTVAIFTPHRYRWSAVTACERARGRGQRLVLSRGGLSPFEHLTDPGDDPIAVREHVVFEHGAVGDRHLQRADPLYPGLEPNECRWILGGNGGNFRREAGCRTCLVGDD